MECPERQGIMKPFRKLWSFLFFMLLTMPVLAAETGVVIKADTIRAEPFRDAKIIAPLSVGDQVEIYRVNGGWLQIKSPKGKYGWVHMLNVRKKTASRSSGSISGLLDIASGRAGTGRIVATTGIRGLNEGELKSAQYDAAELNLVESYTASSADAQDFANQGKLAARKMDYLPAPE